MEDAFAILVWVVAAGAALVAIFTLASTGRSYRQIGGGGMTGGEGDDADVAEDDLREEVRQHVIARNARLTRAGAQPIDVDAEVARRLRELT